jgi:hypothetical protein
MRTEAHERAYRREMLAECGIMPCHDRDTCTHPTLSFAVEGVFWLVVLAGGALPPLGRIEPNFKLSPFDDDVQWQGMLWKILLM